MNFKGTHKFQAPSQVVFDAILNLDNLKSSVPGCEAAWYPYPPATDHFKLRIVTPVPGLEGPYDVQVVILEQQAPHKLVVEAGRDGKVGGKIKAETQITLTDEADGALLSYTATTEAEGPVAVVNNPLFQGMAKHALSTFFKNVNKAITEQKIS